MRNSTPFHPKSGSTNIHKNSHDKYVNQQYFCKDCKHTFRLSHSKEHALFFLLSQKLNPYQIRGNPQKAKWDFFIPL
ncbi:IS1/IS1595 family N-terminal zinc-binding domain-containing protein [Fervidobacterium changbaicum]